ncbi:ABC transporter substrate-binding protein [Microlunatus antarcticus]|uniref:Multiple sugar transport system substrate-binding protein n=1 Tax=Microlunatus antarcticus TaxID=53388 RepID=A0A7W5P5Z0_9ACTN|nr:multiple sugar transport system substrate-binding protein [Microlunatus antarcticus]
MSLSALLVAAACGSSSTGTGSGTGSSAPAVDFSKQGNIEYWQGKDSSGNLPKLIAQFNAQHPNGQVTFHELPDSADQQRQQMIQNTQIKNPAMSVISVDVVWTSEFAAKGYVVPLPADQFPTTGFLQSAVTGATYFNKLYAYPSTSDGGLLYYRKDLLDKYGITAPPTTFDEMKADCDKIKAGENNSKLDCFAGQYDKYEGLTVNFDEAVHSAGGVIVGDDGKPNVATPEAAKGLQTLADWFKNGDIPKAAVTWREENGRTAFEAGQLIFHRNWGYVYNLAQSDKDSVVKGKFDVAPLPGITGPGVSSLGGHNLAITTNGDNKGTAVDFVKFMASEEIQKSNTLATSQSPTLEKLYTDSDLVKKFPFMPTQLKSIQGAIPRPKAVEYGDVTLAIQDAAYGAIQTGAGGGTADATAALQGLQTKLQTLIK